MVMQGRFRWMTVIIAGWAVEVCAFGVVVGLPIVIPLACRYFLGYCRCFFRGRSLFHSWRLRLPYPPGGVSLEFPWIATCYLWGPCKAVPTRGFGRMEARPLLDDCEYWPP